jgi:hypothetical protein
MRDLRIGPVVVVALFLTSTAAAQEPRASLQAFGGLGIGSVTETNTNFGGVIAGGLTDHVQLLAEGGRLGNVLPSTTQTLLGLSPVGLGVSAWYGAAGVRVTGGSRLRPYAEATGGIARLNPHVTGISGVPSFIADLGLNLLDRTAPMGSLGGGVTLEGGPFIMDVGYRHRRVFTDSWMQALALGGPMSSNEVRLGIGVRF